jgi:hypothetical protein
MMSGTRTFNNYLDPATNIVMSGGSSGSSLLNNFSATVDPTSNNDVSNGYSVGSQWINLTTENVFICVSNTLTAAVWKNVTASSSSTTTPGGADGAVQFNSTNTFGGQANYLYWNYTSHRLGIQTATPAFELDVSGDVVTNDVYLGIPRTTRLRVDTTTGNLVLENSVSGTWIARAEFPV